MAKNIERNLRKICSKIPMNNEKKKMFRKCFIFWGRGGGRKMYESKITIYTMKLSVICCRLLFSISLNLISKKKKINFWRKNRFARWKSIQCYFLLRSFCCSAQFYNSFFLSLLFCSVLGGIRISKVSYARCVHRISK